MRILCAIVTRRANAPKRTTNNIIKTNNTGKSMKRINRKFVDWKKTGRTLQLLREDNVELRRAVCGALKHDKGDCTGDCENCVYEMDNHISRKELSEVFGV